MKRIEINSGEIIGIADRTILVDEHESVLGDVFKIGSPQHDMAYLITFSGRVNNTQERESVTVALTVPQAHELMGHILDGLEMLVALNDVEGDN